MHHLGDVGAELLAFRTPGGRPGRDSPAGELRFARPLRLASLDRGTVALCSANRGSRRRSAPLRAFFIEPKTSSPSSKDASIPEIRGAPAARRVAIVLCLCASNRARTRRANSGSERSMSRHAVMPP